MAVCRVIVVVVVVIAVGAGPPAAGDWLQLGDSPRIFGGEYAKSHEFPSQVYVLTKKRDENMDISRIFCGGTIISDKWVVTAAHCVDHSDYTQVRYGSSYLEDMDIVLAKRVFWHENYRLYGRNDNNAANDIGLIELNEPLKLNGRMLAALALPTHDPPLESSWAFVVTGWGRTTYDAIAEAEGAWSSEKLKKLHVNIIPCPSTYEDTNVICVQSPANTGICDGDSGGPLIMNGVIYGVASFVDNIDPDPFMDPNQHCNEKGTWAVYTSLTAHLGWISKHIGN